ncbi:MAG: hypothetical protein GTO55_06115 [Armatimonadetes bacterium]|nr:hypothetical protein [Armatimonadota bacterium]NIM67706.1 hypothetical protein [Armatimonadota bacterium]NIT31260.1 hypothetical protein [Armatimonadota bacterium]
MPGEKGSPREERKMYSSKLEAGERVRLFGSAWVYIWLIPATIAAIFVLRFVLATSMDLITRRVFPSVSDPRSLGFLFLPLWVVALVCLWGIVLRSGVQFTPTGFYHWNWRGKSHFIEYTNVVGLEWNPPPPDPDEVIVYHVSRGDDQSSWIGIRIERARTGLPEAIKNMVAQRCGLTESDSPESSEEVNLLWKPGQRDKFRRAPWWHF